MSGYIPRILLCGDRAEFLSEIGERPFVIVGQIEFFGEAEGQKFDLFQDGRFSIDGKLQQNNMLQLILMDFDISFIVFQNLEVYVPVKKFLTQFGCARSQMLTTTQFKLLPVDGFYDEDADVQLLTWLKSTSFNNLLDFDAHFVKSQILTKGFNNFTEIDCIYDKDILPIKENIYSHIYKRKLDCKLKHYDAILIRERAPIDFDKLFFTLDNSADVVITFARHNSQFSKYIHSVPDNFSKVETLGSPAGEWLICYRRKPPEDFAMYVVTHKELPAEHIEKLPEGYKVIHAGREISQDLGYIGDNTGDNISYLNPYINEITAMYWMWKNTSHTVIGLSHYRRFFTESQNELFDYDNILNVARVYEILKNCDIILSPHYDDMLEFENIAYYGDIHWADLARIIITKKIEEIQPEYLEAFNFVMNSKVFYKCNLFVTRRNIFDAYCRWFFSFFIEAVQEILSTTPIRQAPNKLKRLMGFFAERMLTVWLIKNNLRVKELKIIQTPNL